eukprot:sb/3475987/
MTDPCKNHAASAEYGKRRNIPLVEVYFNEYREVLEDCARRQTSARQLLGAASYPTFPKIRPVARRLFRTYPNGDLSKHCQYKELFNHLEKLHELSEEGRVLSLYQKGTGCIIMIDVLLGLL